MQSYLVICIVELVCEGLFNCSRFFCWGCGGNLSYVRIGNDVGVFIEDFIQVLEIVYRVWMLL